MQLSVIILNYNVRHFLHLCLLSVQKAISGIEAEIIVVDNNSPDDSCQMVRQQFPLVHLIANSENSGFPKGNNIGVSAAKGEFICILNPDTVVAEDTFQKILSFAKRKDNLGIVGCKLIDGAGNFLPESKRGIPTPFVAFTKISSLFKIGPKIFGKYYAQHLSENQTGKVEILVGALMLMKRQVYLDADGFDEDCFMYSDDIDLSYTVLKSGKENYYFGNASVVHFKGESTVKDGLYMDRFREAMNFFYRKHFHISAVFDVFMKAGAWWFARKKKTQTLKVVHPSTYILVSADAEIMNSATQLLGKKVIRTTDSDQKKLNSLCFGPTQFWFDVNFLTFKDIIQKMESLSGKGISFRFVIDKTLIGSDSSLDRGQIQRL